MKIENRNFEIKNTILIRDQKIRIILDWLLEFRFSSTEILSKRISSNKINTNRFFNKLVNDGLIRCFKNVHTKNEKYLMLTSVGVSYLEGEGRDIKGAITTIKSLGKTAQIMHDLSIQNAVLKICFENKESEYDEIIWDRNIKTPSTIENSNRPDAMILSKKGYWVAIEMERWRKENARIFYTFNAHFKALNERFYSGVIYFFTENVDKEHYEKLFNSKEWPLYKKSEKTGKLTKLTSTLTPSSIKNLTQCYKFISEK